MAARTREEESSLSGYEHEFQRSADELKAAGLEGRVSVSDAQKLTLYALYKQATVGDCRSPSPSAFRPVEKAKWTSWHGVQGMDATTAKQRYVLQVLKLLPSFRMPTEAPLLPAGGANSSIREKLMQPVEALTIRANDPEPTMRTRQVTKLSFVQILAQVMACVVTAGTTLFVAMKVALPWMRQLAAERFSSEIARWDELAPSLMPLFWFALGYSLVILLRSRIFAWRVLSGEFVWLSAMTPLARGRRGGRRRRRRQPLAESEEEVFLRKHNIQVVRQPETRGDVVLSTPRVALVLPSDPDAVEFGDCNPAIPFTLEQASAAYLLTCTATADVYYRKFKEPLPDPASRLLESITLLEECQLDEFSAVFRRRLLRFRNEAPYLIKRFASSDFVEYIEDSLLDKQNRRFYVYVKNESFQSLGTLEDFSVYQAHASTPHWTELHQFCRVHITSSSLSFFRSKIESFISNFYCKNAPDARRYHALRIAEEFGAPIDGKQ